MPQMQLVLAPPPPAPEPDEFEVVCLECGAKFVTEDGDYCEVCGGSDVELA